MKTELEIIKQMKFILSDKRNWTQGACARDAHGEPVLTISSYCCSFCLVGVWIKCSQEEPFATNYNAFQKIEQSARALFDLSPAQVNDQLGYEAVMKVLDHSEASYS